MAKALLDWGEDRPWCERGHVDCGDGILRCGWNICSQWYTDECYSRHWEETVDDEESWMPLHQRLSPEPPPRAPKGRIKGGHHKSRTEHGPINYYSSLSVIGRVYLPACYRTLVAQNPILIS